MNTQEQPPEPPVRLIAADIERVLLDRCRRDRDELLASLKNANDLTTSLMDQHAAEVERLTAELAREREMASNAMCDASRRLAQLHHIALHVPPILRAYVWHASFQPPELRTAEQAVNIQTATEFVTLLEQFK